MIDIAELTVVDRTGRAVVEDLTLTVERGESLGIVGESGSGKTTLALALLGALRPGLAVRSGSVRVDGHDMLALKGSRLRAVRRRTLTYLAQDPASALTPTLRVGGQIAELAPDRSAEGVRRRLEAMGLPGDAEFRRRFPHQLSGGQQQRLALARALAGEPAVAVLDEPTTGLDVLTRRLVLDEIDRPARERGLTLVFITHDLPAAARLCDRLVVLRAGRLVEQGPTLRTLSRPADPYTRALVRAVPDIAEAGRRTPAPEPPPGPDAPADPGGDRALLEVRGLRAGHGRGTGREAPTMSGVSFRVGRGECVALLGASGIGKTTLVRCVSGHHRPDGGEILLHGEPMPPDLRRRTPAQRRSVQLVPQDAVGSLNPRRRVGEAIARSARVLRGLDRAAAAAETVRLLGLVGLPAEWAGRLPGEMSGGQRQRVAIARALAAAPEVLLCDEVTASLDVGIQVEILELLESLRRQLGLGVVLITHDLGVVARSADRVLVLDGGGVCEEGAVAQVLGAPRHAWTRSVVGAMTSLRDLTEGPAQAEVGAAD
ncbi:ABC transporter ATP-binding protein [Kitasatospora griseola]|uniref:ABC transporter ATP-binding protein n=1 Tax=Kitasatospora griseola TaxID=2064 RepID=UPI001670365A|nr:ABC transporter ATP-binding protein [Kitasatospora griseola]GGQ66544.1 ABC transporter ATP-binding protein [Kitasatospora griseola]